MQLCFRGVFYSRENNAVETVETDSIATFLGQSYKLRCPAYRPIPEKHILVYRGVPYSTDRSTIEVTAPQPTLLGFRAKRLAKQSP